MDLERRVRALEQRRWRLAAAWMTVAAVAFLSAVREGREVLEAERIDLVDAAGDLRGYLGTDEDGSFGLFLLDEAQRPRAALIHDDAQTGLFVSDADGQVRVGMAQFAHGGGGFALHGPEGKGSAALYWKEQGSLTFYPADGSPARRIGERESPAPPPGR